jgi:AcrR family transcriptional regulator
VTGDEAAVGRRRYRSPLRERQANQARTAVISAATSLFRDKGWAATGMRDVAQAAGISVETVYVNFRSKGELLMACVDLAVVADAEPMPLAGRPEFAALGQGSRKQRIQAAARLLTDVNQRTTGLLLALREAAASDPALAQARREGEDRRRLNVEQGLELIGGRPVTRDEADGLWALMSVEVYDLLTDVRGWTQAEYERWLAGTIDRLLPKTRGT